MARLLLLNRTIQDVTCAPVASRNLANAGGAGHTDSAVVANLPGAPTRGSGLVACRAGFAVLARHAA